MLIPPSTYCSLQAFAHACVYTHAQCLAHALKLKNNRTEKRQSFKRSGHSGDYQRPFESQNPGLSSRRRTKPDVLYFQAVMNVVWPLSLTRCLFHPFSSSRPAGFLQVGQFFSSSHRTIYFIEVSTASLAVENLSELRDHVSSLPRSLRTVTSVPNSSRFSKSGMCMGRKHLACRRVLLLLCKFFIAMCIINVCKNWCVCRQSPKLASTV